MDPVSVLEQKDKAIRQAWARYRASPGFDNFVEFVLLLNSLTDYLLDKSMGGLLHASRQLEQQALALFGNPASHPISMRQMSDLDARVTRLGELLQHYIREASAGAERREATGPHSGGAGHKTQITLIGVESSEWDELISQLGYFGMRVQRGGWRMPEADETADGLFLVDLGGLPEAEWEKPLATLRSRRPLAQIVCLGVPESFAAIDTALSAGADRCLMVGAPVQRVVGQVLERNGAGEQEPFRVLVIEDSRTAARVICRCLEENGILTQVLQDPSRALGAIRQFQPDLILMDMYMPACTGVEAARVIRQFDEFLSIPIVYLSGETDIALQIDALRLGGDHFLTKPFNPVVMNAVVKSKIERYRALRRSMLNDSLTGLLNHISTKQALAAALESAQTAGRSLVVAMLDIDHFKRVNDTHGHPVGDQVIRSLAWLLKQRLRRGDIVGRYGGEEFVLGLIGVTPEVAKAKLDAIREDFSRIAFSAPGGPFHVTFSAGLAACPRCLPRCLDPLLEAADAALYTAKHQGRNRVEVQNCEACCQFAHA